ncbi:hypothetical protein GN958_ATG06082, partial [Phytophthora infestans]
AKAGIAENFKIKDLGRARFIQGILLDYTMEYNTLLISQQVYTESIIKRFGQEDAKPCLAQPEDGVHLNKAAQPQNEDDRSKMSSKAYRSLKHWYAGIKVVSYLLKAMNITYDGRQGTELVAYADADWYTDKCEIGTRFAMTLDPCNGALKTYWQTTVHRFETICGALRLCGGTTDTMTWFLVRDFVNGFNVRRQAVMSPCDILVVDESMVVWKGVEQKYHHLGMPHKTKTPRKPVSYRGWRNRDNVGIEIVEGKDRQRQTAFAVEFGEGTALAL